MRSFKNLIPIFIFIECCSCLTPASLDKTFLKGIEAYTGERWSKCIEKFEESLHLYKLYDSTIINCRLKCNTESYEPKVKEDIEDLRIFERYFNIKNCNTKCLDDGFATMNMDRNPSEHVLLEMRDLRPYEYLHVCYFQMHMFQSAVSAAYTYLLSHPQDKTMYHNLNYYSKQPEIDVEEAVNLEAGSYAKHYNLGRKAYNRDKWTEAVEHLEKAIKEYMLTENSCRAECERQPLQEKSQEFVTAISNNMVFLLECRQHCQDKLNFFHYDSGIEYLADVLNYLQMSYYRLDNIEAAAEAVATYLVLLPNDVDMLANVKFYAKFIKDKTTEAKRSEIIHYMKRDKYEKDLINLFYQKDKDKTEDNSNEKKQ